MYLPTFLNAAREIGNFQTDWRCKSTNKKETIWFNRVEISQQNGFRIISQASLALTVDL